VLKTGGVLAQYATPAELLMFPADRFVEDFVGADRALKRLALQRVRDIDLWRAPTFGEGEPVPSTDGFDVPYALLVDGEGRPREWRSPDGRRSPADPVVERDDVVRDALSDLLQAEAQYGPVVDERGVVVGVLSLELISSSLQQVPDNTPA